MATYVWGLTYTDIIARIGQPPASASASPATAQMTALITEASGDLALILRGLGINPSTVTTTSDDELYQTCRGKVADKALGEWYIRNRREMAEFGQHLIDSFESFKDDLRRMPSYRTGQTGHGVGADSSDGNQLPTSADLVKPSYYGGVWITKANGFG